MKPIDPNEPLWLGLVSLLGILFIFIGPKYLPAPWFQIVAFMFIALCLSMVRRRDDS